MPSQAEYRRSILIGMIAEAEAEGIKTQNVIQNIPPEDRRRYFDLSQAKLSKTLEIHDFKDGETFPEGAIFREPNQFQ